MGMGAYQDAINVIESATSQGMDSTDLRIVRADVEFLQGKSPQTLTTPSWPKDDADKEAVMAHEAWLDVLGGRMAAARKKIHVVADGMAARGFKESAGKVESDMAVVEAEYGDSHKAIEDVSSALAFSHKTNVLINAALVFSLTGQTSQANVIVENLLRKFPKDTFINEVWGPEAQATREIGNGHTKRAIELLESAKPYEMGQIAEFLPIYWRGVAYEREKDSANAAIEFRRIVEHRGVSPTSELYPLALLGLARAAAAKGDWSQSHDCYERLLNQWKDADPDVHVLREARAEYSTRLK
jgi:tetratricopeptide (TPR) repeat protein